MTTPSPQLLEQLRALLGERGIVAGEDAQLPAVILRPADTPTVAQILRLCHDARQPLVVLGGKTGLAQGHHATCGELGLSLERMNAIEELDEINGTVTVQAGCILQSVAARAAVADLLLPLDLGARGTATLGGNIATNAGGNRVIRYGMTRDMVLGLEVVLADGTVIEGLNKMTKNNTGYDIKQWFIGSEGTLGIVTRAVLKLRPLPRSANTALLAVQKFSSVVALLRFLDSQTAGTLSAFEVMWPEYYHWLTRPGGIHQPPLVNGSGHYVLVETQGADAQADDERMQTVLAQALEEGMVQEAALARSEREREAMWAIRDDVAALDELGPSIALDVSLTLDAMPQFIEQLRRNYLATEQSICVVFGHLGDGNLHLRVGHRDVTQFDAVALRDGLYKMVEHYAGSISAEHGIGLAKRDQLHRSRSAEELRLMKVLKIQLDPHNILNPNKIFSVQEIADVTL